MSINNNNNISFSTTFRGNQLPAAAKDEKATCQRTGGFFVWGQPASGGWLPGSGCWQLVAGVWQPAADYLTIVRV